MWIIFSRKLDLHGFEKFSLFILCNIWQCQNKVMQVRNLEVKTKKKQYYNSENYCHIVKALDIT